MDDLGWLDATGQAELVRTGQVHPAELVAAAIARAEAVNETVHAVVRARYDAATEEAERAADGPFRGVPLLLKDLGCHVAGEPAGHGLAALHAVPRPETSYLAAAFRAAGFVVIGRTTVPELGTTVTTEPKDFPAARNPWNPRHSTGGSSGGAAAAVAAGIVAVAHASDGGGSIRIPASECGLVGLKPSRGRVSQGPLLAESWAGGTVDGIVSRSVRDTAAVVDAISGRVPGEPYYAPALPRPLADEVGADPGRLRIGYVAHPAGEYYLDHPACAAAVTGTARLLDALGHRVDPAYPEAMFDPEFARHFGTVIAADTERELREAERLLGRPLADEELEPRNLGYRRAGAALSAPDYLAARVWIGRWARRMATWWDDFDLLLTPTLGAPPPLLGYFTAAGPAQEGPRIASFIPYTAQFNMTGQPAVNLPLAAHEGLPVGVQLVAGYGREDLLIRLAAQLEQAAPWADRHPPVNAVDRPVSPAPPAR